MKVTVLALTVEFWLSVVVLIGWITLYAWNEALIIGRLGEKGARFLNTLLFDIELRKLTLKYLRTSGED